MQDDARPFDAAEPPLLARAQLIRAQVEALRVVLREAEQRALAVEEKAAVAELARACVELTDAVRALLR